MNDARYGRRCEHVPRGAARGSDGADGFVFVTGEYNWGVQPGLKNLTDHFLEEWFWRPAAIASYSAGRFSGAQLVMTDFSATAQNGGSVTGTGSFRMDSITRLHCAKSCW